MADIYVKRGAVVEAEPFDPARTDQGVTVTTDADGNLIAAVMQGTYGPVMVHADDWIVTLKDGGFPCPPGPFSAMYQLLSDVVQSDDQLVAA